MRQANISIIIGISHSGIRSSDSIYRRVKCIQVALQVGDGDRKGLSSPEPGEPAVMPPTTPTQAAQQCREIVVATFQIWSCCSLKLTYWRERGRRGDGKGKTFHMLENSWNAYHHPLLGRSQSQELNPGPPRGWHGPTSLSYHLLPLTVHISRGLQSEVQLRLKPWQSDTRCGHPMPCLNYCAKCPP